MIGGCLYAHWTQSGRRRYESDDYEFRIGQAVTMHEGSDLTIVASGETVRVALDSAAVLASEGISCRVLNMHTIKPLDEEAVIRAAQETGKLIVLEEAQHLRGLALP